MTASCQGSSVIGSGVVLCTPACPEKIKKLKIRTESGKLFIAIFRYLLLLDELHLLYTL